MEAVREALARAQEAADYACLVGAATWGALAGGRARRAALLTRAPRDPAPGAPAAPPAAPPQAAPSHPRHTAAAAQLLAQHAAVNGAKPAYIFQVWYVADWLEFKTYPTLTLTKIILLVNT